MKVLITDDEELTRTGVAASLDWAALGIDEVLQADDGLHGLEMARIHQPEIILSDVRMPRMDGITMLEHVRHFLPDTVVIFMSGYSDKEYLKAAIKLKAVSYIEKPLNPEDIRDAILDAVRLYHQNHHIQHEMTRKSREDASQLAFLLSSPYVNNAGKIRQLTLELSVPFTRDTSFTVFILKMDRLTEFSHVLRMELSQKLEDFLQPFGMHSLHTEKHSRFLIYYIYGSVSPLSREIEKIGQYLVSNFDFLEKYMVVAGETCTGPEHAYQAYTSAVVLLQNSFFFPRNTFLSALSVSTAPKNREPDFDGLHLAFEEALQSRNRSECFHVMDQIYDFYFRNPHIIPGQVRDFYYKLLLTLDDMRKQLHIPAAAETELIADMMENCFCYQDLHSHLTARVMDFFQGAASTLNENPTITLIKDYISKNYGAETLSVKDISAHVFLSASYVCTVFKNETGQTLNQYLTEFRMEKAKLLLADPRYKITDISSRVGYSDGNYFGKSFKKYCGLSPSEYREKIMS